MKIADEEAKEALREFFAILDVVEETDSGVEFNPVYISSVRVLTTKKLRVLLTKLREWCILS